MLACVPCLASRPAAAAATRRHRPARSALRVQATAQGDCCELPADWSQEPPSPEKRAVMNLLLLGAVSLPVAGMAGPYIASFVPRR